MNEKTKPVKHPLRTWYFRNVKNILLNVSDRLFFLFLAALLVIFLLYLLAYTLGHEGNPDVVSQLTVVGLYVFLMYWPSSYFFRSSYQIQSELALNSSVWRLRRSIKNLEKRNTEQDIRSLQVNLNRVRVSLKEFIDASEVISPPIHNYESERMQKRIDVFFNVVSEALFPIDRPFSKADEVEQQLTLLQFESEEHPTVEELEEQNTESIKREMGEIDWFDSRALDECMAYLGDLLFLRTETYSPWSQKHPINLIALSRFFERWNFTLAVCRNCKGMLEKATSDIEEYYKSAGRTERQRRQRVRRITDDALIVTVSVILSTIVQYAIKQ